MRHPPGRDVFHPPDQAQRRLRTRIEMEHEGAFGWQFQSQFGAAASARSACVWFPLHGGNDMDSATAGAMERA